MNNIPYFLQHLPIWNDGPMKEPTFKKAVFQNLYAPKSNRGPKKKTKIEKICPQCGKAFYVVLSQAHRVTCSVSCKNMYRKKQVYV